MNPDQQFSCALAELFEIVEAPSLEVIAAQVPLPQTLTSYFEISA